jgi:hypothetical protein
MRAEVAGPEGVRRMLRAGQQRQVLRRDLAALLEDGAKLGSCRLTRAKFKSGQLDAHFDLEIQGRAGGGLLVRPIQVTWGWLGEARRKDSVMDPAGGVPTELCSPLRVLQADIPGRATRIQVSPFDAKYPRLWRLFEPGYVGGALAGVPGVARSAVGGYAVTTLRYFPGRRHVVRFDPLSGGDIIFAKVRRAKDEVKSLRFEQVVEACGLTAGVHMNVVHRLIRVTEDAVELYPEAAGARLIQLLRGQSQALPGCLVRLGSELRRLHDAARQSVSGLPERTFENELQATALENDHLRLLMPQMAPRIDRLLSRARDLQARLSPEPPTMCHGDFKVEHIWVGNDGGFTFIDCDKAVVSEPAMDLGKFLADLHWWHATCALPGHAQAKRRFLEGYGLGVTTLDDLPARLYEAVVLIRITLRRVRLVDKDWVRWIEGPIGWAEALLEHAGSVRG